MLVLTRQVEQDICIGPDIRVRVLSIQGSQVRLGIEAPRHIPIHRAELLDAIRRQNEAASKPDAAALRSFKRAAKFAARPRRD